MDYVKIAASIEIDPLAPIHYSDARDLAIKAAPEASPLQIARIASAVIMRAITARTQVEKAAFDMLEALRLAAERVEMNNYGGEEDEHLAVIRAAIAKAEGR